jgi:UDP-sulfoquinovose synthase
MKVLITGVDGYLGWPLAQYLTNRGHTVGGADNGYRRAWVQEVGSCSAIPVCEMKDRLAAFEKRFCRPMPYWHADLRDFGNILDILHSFRPDAVVHLAECPSAPFSMIDREHALFVQINNLTTTLNLLYAIAKCDRGIHLIKLGTMGEYGTPNIDIPEGFIDIEFHGRQDRLSFPRQAGSWYHWSKVYGSYSIAFAVKLWDLRATDVMQGIVVGSRLSENRSDERFCTRLDFDEAFGTVVNRFCCQAIIGEPLTVYGSGGQTRSFLSLADSVQCLGIALESPAKIGEYRVFNQFREVYSIIDMARKVQSVAAQKGLKVDIKTVSNPRLEQEQHHYNPIHENLRKLGFRPVRSINDEISFILDDLANHANRIRSAPKGFYPTVSWKGDTTATDVK